MEGEEDREKRDGEKQRARFLASIWRERGRESEREGERGVPMQVALIEQTGYDPASNRK